MPVHGEGHLFVFLCPTPENLEETHGEERGSFVSAFKNSVQLQLFIPSTCFSSQALPKAKHPCPNLSQTLLTCWNSVWLPCDISFLDSEQVTELAVITCISKLLHLVTSVYMLPQACLWRIIQQIMSLMAGCSFGNPLTTNHLPMHSGLSIGDT